MSSIDKVVSAWKIGLPGDQDELCSSSQGRILTNVMNAARDNRAVISEQRARGGDAPTHEVLQVLATTTQQEREFWQHLTAEMVQAFRDEVSRMGKGLQDNFERQIRSQSIGITSLLVEHLEQNWRSMRDLLEERTQNGPATPLLSKTAKVEPPSFSFSREMPPLAPPMSRPTISKEAQTEPLDFDALPLNGHQPETNDKVSGGLKGFNDEGEELFDRCMQDETEAAIRETDVTQVAKKKEFEKQDTPEAEAQGMSQFPMTHASWDIREHLRVIWEIGELNKGETSHTWYQLAYDRKVQDMSLPQRVLHAFRLKRYFFEKAPENFLVGFVETKMFQVSTASAVMLNTIWSAFTADQSVRLLLQTPPEEDPGWWAWVEMSFYCFFFVEILIRLFAYRGWFFLDRGNWAWNWFDLFIMIVSTVNAIFEGVDVKFLRCLRILRGVRMARMVRVIRAFTELRKLLFAVLACLPSLLWCLMFILISMFMFSLFILQGIKSEFGMHHSSDETILLEELQRNFGGMDKCFKTLFTLVVGPDWEMPHQPLTRLGAMYSGIIPMFVICVNIGIMNIVVGVFAEAASSQTDRDIVAQDEISDVEEFIGAMLNLWRDFAGSTQKKIPWDTFRDYFYREEVQAYLASHNLDTSHAKLIFKLCDQDDDGLMDTHEFVLGLLRLKGMSKTLDSKIMLHAIGTIATELDLVRRDLKGLVQDMNKSFI